MLWVRSGRASPYTYRRTIMEDSMNQHALLLLTNVDADTHTPKPRATVTPSSVTLIPATRRRLWGRVTLEIAIALGLF